MHTKTIKLQAEQPINGTVTLLKFAVTLDLKRHRKVGRFIAYVKRICELDDHEYQLTIDGFVVPKNDSTKGLQESHIYRLKIEGRRDRQLQVESEEEEKGRNERAGKERRSKREAKVMKMARKKKEEVSSSSQSDDESLSSSSSSSESSVIVERQPKKVAKKKEAVANEQTPKKKVLVKATTTKPIVSLPPKKQPQKPKKPTIEKVQVPQQESSSSSSSSSDSQEELPKVRQPKNEPAIAPKTANQAKPTAYVTVHQKTVNNATHAQAKKNAVIEESSSQSQPSDYQPIKKKIEIPTANPAANPTEKPKTQGKIPPALRNKFVKKNFDQHKQNQWLTVQKQSLKKWQQTNKNVCQANNKIRFKIVQLDQEKFIPIKSGWITAQVKSIDPQTGIVTLSKVEQEGKPYRESLQIPQHNMDELQLNKLLASKQQISCFQPQLQPNEGPSQQIKQNKQEIQSFQPTNGKNSLEKYICGQVNYYFTDKNYNFDLFMQMHANRHPQKYLNLKTMLNFGKIKKFLYDEDKLAEFLREDEKYQQRTYEVDFQRRLIRKKGIKIEPLPQKQPEGEWGQQHEEN